jgi:hypothetical protein
MTIEKIKSDAKLIQNLLKGKKNKNSESQIRALLASINQSIEQEKNVK